MDIVKNEMEYKLKYGLDELRTLQYYCDSLSTKPNLILSDEKRMMQYLSWRKGYKEAKYINDTYIHNHYVYFQNKQYIISVNKDKENQILNVELISSSQHIISLIKRIKGTEVYKINDKYKFIVKIFERKNVLEVIDDDKGECVINDKMLKEYVRREQ